MSEPWTICPECGNPEFEINLGAKWEHSIEQVCTRCGVVGPDLHFAADTQGIDPLNPTGV
jgi:hypothetical protein